MRKLLRAQFSEEKYDCKSIKDCENMGFNYMYGSVWMMALKSRK
jgi:hypothetical protein